MQDNIRVSIIERAVSLLWPRDNMEFLDVPDLKADRFPCVIPCLFSLSRGFSDALFKLDSDPYPGQSQAVGVLNTRD